MLATAAVVRTERASRYLIQFCQHATAIGAPGRHPPSPHADTGHEYEHGQQKMQAHVEWSDTHAVVTFLPDGQCTMDADVNTLTIRIEAGSEAGLLRVKDIITRDFARFSHRDPLTINWQPGVSQ